MESRVKKSGGKEGRKGRPDGPLEAKWFAEEERK